ncbi:MAG: hypothetical protein J5875_09190 [Paludibacteraceae bacterium]|nr:hypothetical protein [Paludibacteraceae bacterium]
MPLPWLLIGAGALLLGGAAVIIFSDPPTEPIPQAKKIAVLGMKESGKTQFLKTLQNIPYSTYLESTEVEYDEFSVTLPNGKEIKIASGTDLGGAVHFINRYNRISSGCDAVIFVFDVYKFKNDEDYRLKTRARIEYFRDMSVPNSRKVVIGSFADKFSSEEDKVKAQDFVYSKIGDIYPEIKAHNFFMKDMRNRDQILYVCGELFV